MAAVHIVMVIGEYGCKRDLWNKGQEKVNIEHPKCRCMDKAQAAAFPYPRFILLNGESLFVLQWLVGVIMFRIWKKRM